jgi:hypothetical protein
MNVIALILHLVTSHPNGIRILVNAFVLFRAADAEGYDREDVCKKMVDSMPDSVSKHGIDAGHIYALREFYDHIPVEFQENVLSMKKMGF